MIVANKGKSDYSGTLYMMQSVNGGPATVMGSTSVSNFTSGSVTVVTATDHRVRVGKDDPYTYGRNGVVIWVADDNFGNPSDSDQVVVNVLGGGSSDDSSSDSGSGSSSGSSSSDGKRSLTPAVVKAEGIQIAPSVSNGQLEIKIENSSVTVERMYLTDIKGRMFPLQPDARTLDLKALGVAPGFLWFTLVTKSNGLYSEKVLYLP